MKKALLAAAIATAIAAPAANAEVIIYGKVHASIDYLNYDYDSSGSWQPGITPTMDKRSPIDKGWYVASRASRLGFKGTEDLGNGLNLIWKYETGVNVSDSPESGGIFQGARNAYIGLSGDWGTFLYGRHDTPMKMSTGRLDLFSDQLGDYNFSDNPNNALLGPGFEDIRADNAIAYISPNWNGFTAAAAIIPGENSDPSEENNGLADGYSIAAMYSNNGLYLAAAYEDVKNLYTGKYADKKWRVGAGYTINAFTINAVYENQDSRRENIGKDDEHDLWQISGAYDFGNNRVKAAYGENKGTHTYSDYTENKKRKSWAIGLDHKLSKRTTAYAVYADASHTADYNGLDIWTGSGAVIAGGETDIDGFSMGLMHTF